MAILLNQLFSLRSNTSMKRSQIGVVNEPIADSPPRGCIVVGFIVVGKTGVVVDVFALSACDRKLLPKLVRSAAPKPSATSLSCRLKLVYIKSSMLGPTRASSSEVAIVLYKDLTMLCGARLVSDAVDGVVLSNRPT